MTPRMRLAAGLLLATTISACSSPQPPVVESEAQAGATPTLSPEPDPPVPDLPAATTGAIQPGLIVYACDDGRSLTVTYDDYSALVKLPTGSVALPRAESASSAGGDAYIGEELSLYRDGNRVQLQGGNDMPRTCTESLRR